MRPQKRAEGFKEEILQTGGGCGVDSLASRIKLWAVWCEAFPAGSLATSIA